MLTAEGVKIVTYATVLYFVVLCRVRKDGDAWHCFAWWWAVLANQKTPMLNRYPNSNKVNLQILIARYSTAGLAKRCTENKYIKRISNLLSKSV